MKLKAHLFVSLHIPTPTLLKLELYFKNKLDKRKFNAIAKGIKLRFKNLHN